MARLASQFVALPPERRALAFAQTAARMSASSVMVEKDFWVCWLLGLLFADAELAPHLVFQGGTSLSKVYGVIDRFSEDIDLSMSPAFVGADETVFEGLKSRAQRDVALARMQSQCGERTREFLIPRLEATIVEHLGKRQDRATWLRYEDEPIASSPVVHFEYPSAEGGGFDYLRREVKLELGSLTDQRPTEQHAVRAWVVDDFPAAFMDWDCQVTALELPRTFWEKATILHAEHHRPNDQPMPDRYARHYSDMARLLGHAGAKAMLADRALCARVVAWKSRVFARQWARYDLARPGTFRLLPPAARLPALARDYSQMHAMFLQSPPEFDAVLEVLASAERTLNKR
jgi:Nucleotidyl transferase AbiEii toxin, Type IV TA system